MYVVAIAGKEYIAVKRLISILLAVVMAICLVLPAAAASAYFEDVPSSSWFYKSVREAYEQGLMLGVSDSEFKPGDTLTRGMFVTVLGSGPGRQDQRGFIPGKEPFL